MASFDEHIQLAKRNLDLLFFLNQSRTLDLDWQVTMAYYASYHFLSAHAAKLDAHPETHHELKTYVGPSSTFLSLRMNPTLFAEYGLLEGLSRQARYMCNEYGKAGENAHKTKPKHLNRAIRYLDNIMRFMESAHSETFTKVDLFIDDLKDVEKIRFFNVQAVQFLKK